MVSCGRDVGINLHNEASDNAACNAMTLHLLVLAEDLEELSTHEYGRQLQGHTCGGEGGGGGKKRRHQEGSCREGREV